MPKPLLPGQWLRVVGLTVTLLLALLPAAPPTSAQDVPSETITVDGIKYTFDIHYENDTETLCVAAAEAPDIENIVVPDSILYNGSWYVVRSINFTGNKFNNLKSITIPKFAYIGFSSPFRYCPELEAINVADGNEHFLSIDGVLYSKDNIEGKGSALIKCPPKSKLTSVNIPSYISLIQGDAFADCINLTSIEIPNSVNEIWGNAFKGCTALESITIKGNITELSDDIFNGCSNLKSFNIPATVTKIGGSTFRGCTSLKNLELPPSVTEIEANAFSNCTSLISLAIPEGVAAIGYGTFMGCSSLEAIKLPSTLKSIDQVAFQGCSSLISIKLPEGLKTLGYFTFDCCSALQSAEIPSTLEKIGPWAFNGCQSLSSVNIAEGVDSIGEAAFLGCEALAEINLPNSIHSIEDGAFRYCRGLKTITIPEGVETIGTLTFEDCTSLRSVSFPSSLTTLYYDAFHPASSNYDLLKSLTFNGITPPTILPEGGSLRWLSEKTIIYVPAESVDAYQAWTDYTVRAIGSVDIPEHGATKAWFDADEINLELGNEDNMVPLTLNIEPADYDGNIEWNVSDENIIDFTIDEENNRIAVIKPTNNGGSTVITATVTTPDGSELTSSCTVNVLRLELEPMYNLLTLKPNSEVRLKGSIYPQDMNERFSIRWSSDDEAIATIDQDGNLKTLAEGSCKITLAAVYDNNDPLMSKNIPLAVTSTVKADIESESLLMKAGEERDLLISVPYSRPRSTRWVSDNDNVVTFDFEKRRVRAVGIGNAVLSTTFQFDDGQKEIVTCPVVVCNIGVGDTITVDGINCRLLTSSTIEVTGLATGTEYTEVIIPSSVTFEDMSFTVVKIADNAFQNSEITSVTLPSTLTEIGLGAFDGCRNLTSISIPEGVAIIGDGAFQSTGISSVILPASLTVIEHYAFAGCSNLTSISIPEQVTEIGQGAFQYTALTSVTLPASLKQMVNGAFYCYDLTSLEFKGTVPPVVVDYQNNPASLEFPNDNVVIYVPAEENVEAYKAIAGNYTVMPIGSVVSDEFEYEGLRYRINKESETPSVELIGVVEGNTDANVTIPPTAVNGTEEYSVVGIAANAFANNQDIKSVEIPASVTSIGDGAFAGCDSLNVTMPGNIEYMGDGVFENCSGLTVSIETPKTEGSEDNTTLGDGFAGTPITEVTISDEITEIAEGAFKDCRELTSIVIPDQVETIGASTFANCTKLENVTLGSGVSTIAPDAFAGAEAITEVVCLSTTPPEFAVISRAFEGGFEQSVYDNATLIVPAGTEAAYKEAPIWKEFTKIQEVADVPVDGITIDKSTVILNAGNSTQLNATVEPADAEVEIEWTSSNEDVASVDPLTGEVTAKNTGVATITATVKGTNISASCTVIVSNPTGIDDVDNDGISIKGINDQIIVTGAPADADVEIYSIAGSRIAVEKGNCAVSVNAGIYVVRVAGTTVKVAMK